MEVGCKADPATPQLLGAFLMLALFRPTESSCFNFLAFLQDKKTNSVFDLPKQK